MGIHDLSLTGRAGSILWTLMIGGMMYTVGFATSGWVVRGDIHVGLWETCHCGYKPRYGNEGILTRFKNYLIFFSFVFNIMLIFRSPDWLTSPLVG